MKSRLKKENAKSLPSVEVVDKKYIPNIAYFHCITKKKNNGQCVHFIKIIYRFCQCSFCRNVSQTHDYVMFFMNLLFDHGVFENFEFLKVWSDGCSKHFKTYPIHYYMATLQARVCLIFKYLFLVFLYLHPHFQSGLNISWQFLPPRDAHNRADGAAGHLSQQINRAIKNTFLLTEVGHISFISQNLRNWYYYN